MLADHPALLLSALYVAASAIGMLFSWAFLRRFGINVFLYAEIGDFLLASLREPFTWLLVLLAILLVWSDNMLSRYVERKATMRWLRWYASPRYRALNYFVAVMMIFGFIDLYATSRARDVYAGEGEAVAVMLSDESASKRALILGTTGQFLFLYDREYDQVAIHPHENVMSITMTAPARE